MSSAFLTFCIPTYNRAELLNITLSKLISVVREAECEIIVSDNGSIDNTRKIVETHIKNYSNLKYFSQAKNVGYDRNVALCYENSTSEYIWLFGDSKEISEDSFCKILNIIKQRKYQGIVVNSENRIMNIPSKIYNDATSILTEIGWHTTLLCSTIISKEFINNQLLKRYFDTDLIHFGVFFESIVKYENLNILWIADNVVSRTEYDLNFKDLKKSSWSNRLFDVFAIHWFSIVMSLPNQISLNSKLKCIKAHDQNTHIFNIRQLIALRARKEIIKSDYIKAQKILPFITELSSLKIRLVFLIPYPLLKIALLTHSKLKLLK
ncbi:hypothetical protein SDC9_39657 [bioreactor metagenome]|uniref:Glycosyltransferase 2-like domain-containing protein n=1 Tax=bioreactor metagenome TaxID=1076179 RepID=A0A644VQ78_9ZZZZ